jgi:hypothetical protein
MNFKKAYPSFVNLNSFFSRKRRSNDNTNTCG